MDLRTMIRESIPSPWEVVLKKRRKISKYVDLVYATHCGSGATKTFYLTRAAINSRYRNLRRALQESNYSGDTTSFWYSFNALELLTAEEREVWKEIDREIQQYKISCS